MDAQELFLANGTPLKNVACGKCGRVWASAEQCNQYCCVCFGCRQPLDAEHRNVTAGNYHRECWDQIHAKNDRKRLARAEVVEDYTGPVFADGVGYSEGYFEDMGELVDYLADWCDDDEGRPRPQWAYCCIERTVTLDAEHILASALDDHHPDAYEYLPTDAVAQFTAACAQFNAAVAACTFRTWDVDYSRKVLIPAN